MIIEVGKNYVDGQGMETGRLLANLTAAPWALTFPYYSIVLNRCYSEYGQCRSGIFVHNLVKEIEEPAMTPVEKAQEKIKTAKAQLEEAQKELEAASRPKFRHGDVWDFPGVSGGPFLLMAPNDMYYHNGERSGLGWGIVEGLSGGKLIQNIFERSLKPSPNV